MSPAASGRKKRRSTSPHGSPSSSQPSWRRWRRWPCPARPRRHRSTRPSLLTLDEAETVFPQLRGRHDDGHRGVYAFGIDAPDFTTSPLRCDRYRNYRGTSRVQGYFYSLERPVVRLRRNIVRMRTTAEARAVLAHYRAYIEACTGTHATTDGDGGKATMKVPGWQPRRVGDERVGMLDAFIQYGLTSCGAPC